MTMRQERAALRTCTKNVTDKDKLFFDCRTCPQFLISKLNERSPLRYPLTEALTFLNPTIAASDKNDAFRKLTQALEIVLTANLLPAITIQNADREYRHLLSDNNVINKMKMYSRKDTRLDDFWMSLLAHHSSTENLELIKLLPILSHVNATLERGFSVNDSILVKNLKQESFLAQRVN